MNKQNEMSDERREAVKREIYSINNDPKRRGERNTLWVYYLELCLRTNLAPV